MQLGSMFICNCNIALHVSDAFCVHLLEHLENCLYCFWYSPITINVSWYYIVTYPVTLAQPAYSYTPVYVSFISCSMSYTRSCYYSF